MGIPFHKKRWSEQRLAFKVIIIVLFTILVMIAFSLISFISLKSKDYFASIINVKEVKADSTLIEKLTDGNYKQHNGIVSVRYPHINHFLPNHFLDDVNNEMRDCALNSVRPDVIDYSFDYKVGVETPNLISIKMEQSYNYNKTLHGSSSVLSVNIDPDSNKPIDFFDVFDLRRNALCEIKALIINDLKKNNYDYFSETLESASFIPRFFLKNDSIEFIFSQYEVTPGYCGSVSVNISYKDIIGILRKDGPLGDFVPLTGLWFSGDHFVKQIMNATESDDSIETEDSTYNNSK